ncbi:hypothetical protein ACQCVP_15060 [Rossellomorea vietnamensis]|uniref:hypothetical protein n=1 Tax=Rossellomorea vietnamensis TaxID=218284 RepID=UPI003CEA153F
MKQTMNSVLKRFKKYAIFLILLPLILGAVSYFLTEDSRGPVSDTGVYFAEAQIDLGEFNDPMLNHPDNVKSLITSSAFLENAAQDANLEFDIAELKSNLILENVQGEMLIISLTGAGEEIVTSTLQGIVDRLMSLSEDRYTEWTALISSTIDELEETEPGSEEAVTKQEFIYDLRQDLYDASPAEVIDPVMIVSENASVSSQPENPLKNMVFGLIIGLMLSLFLLLLPEAFRE